MKTDKIALQVNDPVLCDGVTVEERERVLKNIPWSFRVIKPRKMIELKTLIYVSDKIRPPYYEPKVAGGIHDFWKIILIKKGKALVVSGDKEYVLTDGMMLINPPMRFNDFKEIDGNELEFMLVYSEMNGEDMKFFEENPVFNLRSTELSDIIQSVDYLCSYYVGIGDRRTLQRGVSLFEASILGLVIKAQEKQNLKADKRYTEIIQVLNSHIDEKLTVAKVSQECGMSVSLIKKIFAENSDCGIMAYFNKMKLRRAAELLEYGLCNDEIAARLSFSSTSYFLYFFRREMGMSPKKYLKHIKSLNENL